MGLAEGGFTASPVSSLMLLSGRPANVPLDLTEGDRGIFVSGFS